MYPLRKAIIANISGSILNLSSVYLMDGSVLIPRDHPKGHQQRACLLAGTKRRQSDEETRRQSDRHKGQRETQIQRAFNDFHTFHLSRFSFHVSRDSPGHSLRNLPTGFLSASWIGSTQRWALPNAQRNSLEIRSRVAYSTGQST